MLSEPPCIYAERTSKVDNIYYGTLQHTVRITHPPYNHHLPTLSPHRDGVDFVNRSNRFVTLVTVYYNIYSLYIQKCVLYLSALRAKCSVSTTHNIFKIKYYNIILYILLFITFNIIIFIADRSVQAWIAKWFSFYHFVSTQYRAISSGNNNMQMIEFKKMKEIKSKCIIIICNVVVGLNYKNYEFLSTHMSYDRQFPPTILTLISTDVDPVCFKKIKLRQFFLFFVLFFVVLSHLPHSKTIVYFRKCR